MNFDEAISLVDYKSNLSENNALELDKLDDLMVKIKETITEDYRETYFEAIKENWSFNYFLSDSENIYHQTILINNRLSYPGHLRMGDVIYPILAIKKYKGNYYFWNLLDKDDVDIESD